MTPEPCLDFRCVRFACTMSVLVCVKRQGTTRWVHNRKRTAKAFPECKDCLQGKANAARFGALVILTRRRVGNFASLGRVAQRR